MAKRTGYIYGTNAYAYRAEPVRPQDPNREVEGQPKSQPKKKIDKVSVVLCLATLAFAFFVCFTYLQKQFEITYLNKSMSSLENQVMELQKENAAASEALDSSMDLKQVYEKATKELGMVHAKDNQVYTYTGKKSNQVRQHGNIPTK